MALAAAEPLAVMRSAAREPPVGRWSGHGVQTTIAPPEAGEARAWHVRAVSTSVIRWTSTGSRHAERVPRARRAGASQTNSYV